MRLKEIEGWSGALLFAIAVIALALAVLTLTDAPRRPPPTIYLEPEAP